MTLLGIEFPEGEKDIDLHVKVDRLTIQGIEFHEG